MIENILSTLAGLGTGLGFVGAFVGIFMLGCGLLEMAGFKVRITKGGDK